jgi:proteasome lid subunit RPN8/RPN11
MNFTYHRVEPRTISKYQARILKRIAHSELPIEACGVILRDGTIVEYPNTCPNPEHGFDFAAQLNHNIKAIWHSHPNGLTTPSDDDLPMIETLARRGFNCHHLIVTAENVYEYAADFSQVASASQCQT